MSFYEVNWFKGSRTLFQNALDNGTPWDFFVMDVILHRVNFETGKAFIGLRELGRIVGKSHKCVKTSLKRLDQLGYITVTAQAHVGTTIKVNYASAYQNNGTSSVTEQVGDGYVRVDSTKTRLDRLDNTTTPLVHNMNTCIQRTDKKRRTASAQLPDWQELKPVVFEQAKAKHGYNEKFMEDRWEELLAYDEGKPYKNRKLGALSWFNSNITKDKWAKRTKTKDDEFQEIKELCERGGIKLG